eukprot:6904564-Prymnesium_polylepis.1
MLVEVQTRDAAAAFCLLPTRLLRPCPLCSAIPPIRAATVARWITLSRGSRRTASRPNHRTRTLHLRALPARATPPPTR